MVILMAKKKKSVTENYPTGKAALVERLSLDGTVDGIVDKQYTDDAVDDFEKEATVSALNAELRELKTKKKR